MKLNTVSSQISRGIVINFKQVLAKLRCVDETASIYMYLHVLPKGDGIMWLIVFN